MVTRCFENSGDYEDRSGTLVQVLVFAIATSGKAGTSLECQAWFQEVSYFRSDI